MFDYATRGLCSLMGFCVNTVTERRETLLSCEQGGGRRKFDSKRSVGTAGGLLEKAAPADRRAPAPAAGRQLLLKPVTPEVYSRYLYMRLVLCFSCPFLSLFVL